MTVTRAIRGMLESATEAHAAGVHDRAVLILCKVLEDEFNRRLPQVIARAMSRHPLPDVGIRCVQAVMQMRVERTQRQYTRGQVETLIEYADLVIGSLPRASASERVCVLIQRLTHGCASESKCVLLRRALFLFLQRLNWPLLLRVPLARQHFEHLGGFLSFVLSEPERKTAAILRAHHDGMRRLLADAAWFGAGDDNACRSPGFIWNERNDYRKVISGSSASRVVATIHMGDFLRAFSCLSGESDPGWQALTLVREIDDQHVAAPKVASIHQRILRPGEYSATEIVAALRRGRHSLCILFDLREGFGGTVETRFFGRSARTVKGPAALAIASGSPIIPFVTYQQRGLHHLEMAELIDTRLLPDESFQGGVRRVTQQLIRLAESWIRRFPEQWKFLPQLPLYFDHTGQAGGGADAVPGRPAAATGGGRS